MGVSLELGMWDQISMTWRRSSDGNSGILSSYDFNAQSNVTSRTLVLSPNPSIPGATLAVGQWAYSTVSVGAPPSGAFVGVIDEVRIWNELYGQIELSANWMANVDPAAPGLASLWKFN